MKNLIASTDKIFYKHQSRHENQSDSSRNIKFWDIRRIWNFQNTAPSLHSDINGFHFEDIMINEKLFLSIEFTRNESAYK